MIHKILNVKTANFLAVQNVQVLLKIDVVILIVKSALEFQILNAHCVIIILHQTTPIFVAINLASIALEA